MDNQLMWEETISKIYVLYFEHLCWFRYACPLYNFSMTNCIYTFKDDVLAAHYSQRSMEENAKGALTFYKEEGSLQKVLDLITEVSERNAALVQKVDASDLRSLSNEELLALIEEDYEVMMDSLGAHYLSMPQAFWEMEKVIKQELEEKTDDVDAVFLDLVANTKPMKIEQSDEALLKKLAARQKELLHELSLSSLTVRLLEVIRVLSWHRINDTRIFWTNCRTIERSIFDVMAERFNIPAGDFTHCMAPEVMAILKKGEVSSSLKDEIAQRKDFLLMKTVDEEREVFYGNQAGAIYKELVGEEDYAHKTEVKGVPANSGIVRGKARVFKNENFDLDTCLREMQDGEILICQNTWPELYPVFSKAKAIVTNEGGIASHAAIVSREMDIPSVAGAIIATKVFSTGDVVEVDGGKGVVRRVS